MWAMGPWEVDIYPVLIDTVFPLHAYGAMGALGFVAVVFLILRRASALGIERDHVVDVIFWAAMAGIVGSRVLFVLQNPELFDTVGQMVNLRNGGLVFYGAMLAGLPAGGFVMWYRGIGFFAFMDIAATALPVGHAFARMGCLLAGCCFGLPSDLPWAVTFSHPLALSPPHGIPLHPVQAYESALLLGIALFVNLLYGRRQWVGQAMCAYLVLYAFVRSVTEQFRGDVSRGFVAEEWLGQTLSFSTSVSMGIALVALVLFAWLPRRMLGTIRGPEA